MRTERRQPKDLRSVRIPEELAAFLVEVDQLIDSADELAVTESDDLLQCQCAYGGLCEEGGDRYLFTYFPETGIRHKWIFELLAAEVSAIAAGSMRELRLWFCKSDECRSGFGSPDHLCFYCDYVEDGSS